MDDDILNAAIYGELLGYISKLDGNGISYGTTNLWNGKVILI